MRMRSHEYGRRRLRLWLYGFTVLMLVCLLALLSLDAKLKPLMREYAKSTATYLAATAINDAVNEEISRSGASYQELVTLEKDNEGQIAALYTNIIKLNRLKSQVAELVLDELRMIDTSEVAIPLGNATGINFLSGKGPQIDIEIVPLGSVTTACGSEFTSAGINQTRHRLTMIVTATVTILLPRDSVTSVVTTEVSIAETILVGSVPDSYTNIVDTRDLIEQGIDYAMD